MICPKCKCMKTTIVDASINKKRGEIYRRRMCSECRNIFYTVEFAVEVTPSFVDEWAESHEENND